jgi:glyoxylase-like metal-dependent hydrolase (beta-lactamase superfamily II)
VNAYLINTGTKLILIDTGAGSLFGPTLGKLVRNLEASGYRPDQVDEIYITHMHPDHVGGLVSQGKLVFPNAIVRADQREADQWLDPAHLEAAPADSKGFFQGAMASLQPYVAAGKFKPFSGDTELAPGIRAVSSRGHTDGHTTYRVTSGGQTLLIVGDLIHAAALQFPDPRITIAFDTDASSALAQRLKTFAEVSDKGYWMAAAHLAFPGIGHLRSQGDGYRWIPINYASLVGP